MAFEKFTTPESSSSGPARVGSDGERIEGAPRWSVGEQLEYLTVFECSYRVVKSRRGFLDIRRLILIRDHIEIALTRASFCVKFQATRRINDGGVSLSMKHTVRDYLNSSAYRYVDLLR